MPLSCDCYPGCWGDHSASWPRIVEPSDALRSIVRYVVPYGSYVNVDDEVRLETSALIDHVNHAGQQAAALSAMADLVHQANINWRRDFETGELKRRNVGELLMLCVSELSEALEGHRKNLPDDKLLHRSMFEVEIADCLIRLFDLCGGMNLDIGGAFVEKMAFNRTRADHQIDNRKMVGGKAY